MPIGAAVLVLAPKVVPESRLRSETAALRPIRSRSRSRPALVVFVYAISQAPQVGWAATQTVAMLATASALLLSFLVIETRVEAPLLPMRLFRLSTVAGSNAVGFLLGASFFTFIFIGTLYMQQVLGFSALKTGVAWLTASVTSVAFAGLSQMLVTQDLGQDGHGLRHGAHRGRDPVGDPDPDRRELLARPGRTVLRRRAWARHSPSFPCRSARLAGVTERDAGVASGLINTSQQLGGAIGVAVASSIAASHFRTLVHHGYGTAAALTGGFQWALWVCGLAGLVAIPVTFLLIRRAEMAKAIALTHGQEVANRCADRLVTPEKSAGALQISVHA